jgi:hypothetical protein
MNRLKLEELKKYDEITKNMSEKDKKNYDFLIDIQIQFEQLIRKLHSEFFPEEYDFMYDDFLDSKRRKNGENPMKQEYINAMNKKRVKLGFLPLNKNGYSSDSLQTLLYCKKLITKEEEFKSFFNL